MQNKIDLVEKMGKADIRDNRTVVRFEMDISYLTVQNMEKLFRYIGLQQGEISVHEMD